MRTVVTLLLLAASAALTAYSITAYPFYGDKTDPFSDLVLMTAALWVLFALAVIALRRVPASRAVVVVLVGSIAIGGAALAGPPNTSTDSARYAWDGIVQNAGISPYEYVPADPALRDLRPEWLFPTPTVDDAGEASCPGDRIVGGSEPGTGERFCTAINRAQVPTIYPPLAEMLFAAIRFVVGPDAQYWPMQVVGLLMSLGVTGMLLRLLTRIGRDPRWAALWGWCPLVATEAVTNSHIDILAGLLVLVATALVAFGRRWTGGIALGAAIAVKLIPVIAAPALLRRQPWKIIVASIATFALLYVPYVLSTGIGVLGYLPGYLVEEGFESGERFILFSGLGGASTVVVVLILGITAALVWWKTNPDDPWLGQLVMIGVVLIAVTPRYPWYALLLVPFIAMTGRWEWLAVALALTQRGLIPLTDPTRVAFAIAIAIIVVTSIRRAGPDGMRRLGRFLRHPFSPQAEDAPSSRRTLADRRPADSRGQ